jgi:uncharacterized protein YukE
MQQITDEQFAAAMERAVKDKGQWHQAPGSYRTSTTGEAYCIVGYALSTLGEGLCPIDNSKNADVVLKALGCSERMAMAAFAAQYSNDRGQHWGQVLAAFRAALRFWHPGIDTLYLIRRAEMQAQREWTHQAATNFVEQVKTVEMQMQTFSEALAKAQEQISKVCFELKGDSVSPEAFEIMTGQPVLVKKDHALTA